MSTDIFSAMNAVFGTSGAGVMTGSPAAVGMTGDPEVTFGDILGQAVDASEELAAADSGVKEAVLEEDVVPENERVTFAQLVSELKEKVSSEDESVIAAALRMLLTTGKAAEKLFGTGSVQLDDDNEISGGMLEVMSVIIGNIPVRNSEDVITEEETDGIVAGSEEITDAPAKNYEGVTYTPEIITDDSDVIYDDEDAAPIAESIPAAYVAETPEVSSGTAELFRKIASTIRTGFYEGRDTKEIVKALKNALARDDRSGKNLADAVSSVLCALSGFGMQEDITVFTEEYITPEAVEKLDDIAEAISSDLPAAEKTEAVLTIASEPMGKALVIEEDEVSFVDYLNKPGTPAIEHITRKMGEVNRLKVNNVSEQAYRISETRAAAAAQETVPVMQESFIPERTETEVFRELGEFVNTQLTERISGEITASVPEGTESVRELTVVLRPRELGEVAVKIVSDASGAVTVTLSAANAEVGRAISENAAALSADFAKQNIEVRDILVVDPSQASSYMGLDFTNQGFSRSDYSEEDRDDRGRGNGRRPVTGISSDIPAADAAKAAKLLKEAKLWTTA